MSGAFPPSARQVRSPARSGESERRSSPTLPGRGGFRRCGASVIVLRMMPRSVVGLWLLAPFVGVGLAAILLAPPPADLRLLAGFLLLSEILSLGLAWAALRLMRAMKIGGIQAKLGLTY